MTSLPTPLRRHRLCDCGACCDTCGHDDACMSEQERQGEPDVATEVAQEDGYMHQRTGISTTPNAYPST